MDLTPYVAALREQLARTAEAGGEDAQALAGRLAASLDSAARLALLDALGTAAAEITQEMAPGSVEVRLRGREPEFVVVAPPVPEPEPPAGAGPAYPTSAEDAAAAARINLRLPQDLKDRVDDAARGAGLSVNAWLVRCAAAALAAAAPAPPRTSSQTAGRYRGWVR